MATAAVGTAEASFTIDEIANPDAVVRQTQLVFCGFMISLTLSLQIEADDESTSDYSESNPASSTQSLTDSVRDYVYENGRLALSSRCITSNGH